MMLFDALSPDQCAEATLGMLDVRDLMGLEEAAAAGLLLLRDLLPRGAAFRAARVLLPSELDWFKERGISVELHQSAVTDTFGNKFWFENGNIPHRDGDLPAVEFLDGNQEWWVHGKRHRDGDKPAVVPPPLQPPLQSDTTTTMLPPRTRIPRWAWYKNGKLCRDDHNLPAEVRTDGIRVWTKHYLLHRDGDLPAVEWPNGDGEWYQNGNRHRDGDQPAVVKSEMGGGGQRREWYKDGRLHREGDQPAFVRGDRTKMWYQQGVLHRDGDQPAVISSRSARWITLKWYFWGKMYHTETENV